MSITGPSRWSLRTRLTALFTLVFGLAGVGVVVISYLVVQSTLYASLPGAAAVRDAIPASPFAAGQPQISQDVIDRLLSAIDESRSATLHSMLVQSTVALCAMTALAAVVGWLLAGRVLQRLSVVTATAQRIDDDTLHERVGLTGGHDEVQALADAFDSMLARLDRAFDTQSRFAANASHELRTPLAVQRTLLEVETSDPDASDDLRRVGRLLLTVNERHERVVDDLLTLTRSQQRVTATDPVDLADVVRSTLSLLPHHDVTVHAECSPAPTHGSVGLIDRLVVNLISNAVQHNLPPGPDGPTGEVWVTTGTDESGAAVMTIANTGPFIPQHEVAGLLEPFTRGRDRVGTGNGLGLSIVAAVVRGHAGSLDVRAREAGGLTVGVALPA